MQRLVHSYARDAHSPSVVASKRDVHVVTAYLLQLISVQGHEGAGEKEGAATTPQQQQPLSASSSHSSLPPGTAAAAVAAAADDQQGQGQQGHTPIPAPPASPFAAEPIIETSSAQSSTTTSTSQMINNNNNNQPPPKPLRKQRRKIRLQRVAGRAARALGALALRPLGGLTPSGVWRSRARAPSPRWGQAKRRSGWCPMPRSRGLGRRSLTMSSCGVELIELGEGRGIVNVAKGEGRFGGEGFKHQHQSSQARLID